MSKPYESPFSVHRLTSNDAESFPSTAQSSPYLHSPGYPYQQNIDIASPPISMASTSWSPRAAGTGGHSRHTSQLSELSGDGLAQELPSQPVGLHPVSELDGHQQPGITENERSQTPPPGGPAHTPAEGDMGRRDFHELDSGNR